MHKRMHIPATLTALTRSITSSLRGTNNCRLGSQQSIPRLTYDRHQRLVPDSSAKRRDRNASPVPGGSTCSHYLELNCSMCVSSMTAR